MQEKRLSRILGIYRSNPSGSVLKVWKSYPESFYKKLVNKRFFLKIRDNPTFGITSFQDNRNDPCALAENQSRFKHWEVMAMRKIVSCEFNLDTACVELCLDDGTLLSIDCTAVENEVANSMYQRSELDWLIYNDPLAYAELILNGEPKLYLKTVTKKNSLD